jgi:hypothetical protein
MNMLGHDDVAEYFEMIMTASLFEGLPEYVSGGLGLEIRLAAVATEGDKVVVSFILIAFQAQRHGWILSRFMDRGEVGSRYTRLPTLGAPRRRWGTQISNLGHPAQVQFPSVQNAFYDKHVFYSDTDILGLTSASSCSAKATQVYMCDGKNIGTFALTNTYSHGTISGQSVTNITTTKVKQ